MARETLDRPAIRFDILTLFPEIFDGFLSESLLNKAIGSGLIEVDRWNIRDWSKDKHHKVDDRPYGGGPGMVIRPDIVCECVEEVRAKRKEPGRLLLMSPAGRRLDQEFVKELSRSSRLLLLCGRYEGFDDRVRQFLNPDVVSIGDYVCNGGEIPAMVVIETIIRLIPGVLGDSESAAEDSFSSPGWIEYPQFTRPYEYRGLKVPEVLLGGHHAEIARWRKEQAEFRSARGSEPADSGVIEQGEDNSRGSAG